MHTIRSQEFKQPIVSLFENGDHETLRKTIINELRKDYTNHELWYMLSGLWSKQDYRDKCIRAGLAFQRIKIFKKFQTKLENDDTTGIIEARLVGISYENRCKYIPNLNIRQRVILRREKDNEYDQNAIYIETNNQNVIGYLPKSLAARIAPYLDGIGGSTHGILTEINCDSTGEAYGIKIAFNLPITYIREDAYACFEITEREDKYNNEISATYLLLNTSSHLFGKIKRHLSQQMNIKIASKGISTKEHSHNSIYKWYMRFNNLSEKSKKSISDILRTKFELLTSEESTSLKNKLFTDKIRAQRKELSTKESALSDLQEKLHQEKKRYSKSEEWQILFDKQNIELQKRINILESEIESHKIKINHLKFINNSDESKIPTLTDNPLKNSDYVNRIFKGLHRISCLQPRHIISVYEKAFEDRIFFLETAKKTAEKVPGFRNNDQMMATLWLLCTEIYEYFKEGRQAEINTSLCKRWRYAPNLGKSTKKMRKKLTFIYNKKEIYMEKHLRIGVSKNKNETMRIYFDWLNGKEIFLVGHCGKHI